MIKEDRISKVTEFNGIEFYKIPENKFKTFTIGIYFCDVLNKERVSSNAMIPFVLRRGSQEYSSSMAISRRLHELYGASFYSDVTKKGEIQMTYFSSDAVVDKYIPESENIFRNLTDLIFGIVTDPFLEDGKFKKDYVEQEKTTLIDLIETQKNNKDSYAIQRCFEEMCKDEPYSINEGGDIESIKSINADSLYDYYRNFYLKKLPIKVFITGEVPDADINYLVDKFKSIPREEIVDISKVGIIKSADPEVNHVIERFNVVQGKLCLGFRSNLAPSDDLYYALTVCNTVFGGGIHSKLFQNVREKAGLAYYASSRMDKFKGVIIVSSGIEISNKDKAMKIILEQLEEIKKGNITDVEFDSAIKTYSTAVNLLKDGQRSIADFFLGQTLLGIKTGLTDFMKNINQVTIDDVVKAAQKIELDTTYFLTAEE